MRTHTPGARFRHLLGIPEPEVVYWTPDPAHPVSRVCTVCGEDKPFPEFYLRYKTGRRVARCRACARTAMRAWYHAHAKEVLGQRHEHDSANRETLRARKRADYEAHREKRLETVRRYQAAHAEERRVAKRQHYAENREACLETCRRWREQHPERTREYGRRYRRENPLKQLVRLITRLLRDTGLLAPPDRCEACGAEGAEHHHVDYADPRAVVALCHPCHMRGHFAVWRKTGGGPVKYPEEYGGRITTEAPRKSEKHREEGP